MRSKRNRILLAGWIIAAAKAAEGQVGSRVEDWTVPEHAAKSVDLSRPVAFVAVTPCRVVDTRGAVSDYGGPILSPNTDRSFDVNSGPCTGIPDGVAAYSLNFTVTQTQGPGDIRVWPEGGTPPLVSTLNYLANQTLANAAIVPAGTGDGITVIAAVSGTHLIIDINGYFTDKPNVSSNLSFIVQAQGDGGLVVRNMETASAGSSGIIGITASTGVGSYGVIGQNSSGPTNENAGVRGRGGSIFTMPPYGQAGVRGENRDSFGILGISENNFGVAGSNVTNGLEQAYGALACSDTSAVCGMGTLNVTGTKSFVEPHPTDPSRTIEYVSLEGPEAGTYFRGRGRFIRGIARIAIPESFRMVTGEEGLSIQVTPIGEMATYAVVRIDLNEIVVKASRNVEFFYTVNGLRRGYEEFVPIVEKSFFMPRSSESMMPTSLSAEAKRKLIANGTYNADGTVNMETAKRLGWTDKWKGGAAPKKE